MVKPIWILLKQETVSGSGISWAICKSAPRSRQITMPTPHRSVFLQAGCPSCRPTNSVKALKARWGQIKNKNKICSTSQTATCLCCSSYLGGFLSSLTAPNQDRFSGPAFLWPSSISHGLTLSFFMICSPCDVAT